MTQPGWPGEDHFKQTSDFNARSLLPKYYELLLNVELHNPDVVCVVESWLSTEIQNSEIHIPGYFIVRLDRNRHGGGVIMFIETSLQLNSCLPVHLLN